MLFHLGRAGRPPMRRLPAPTRQTEWEALAVGAPQLVATMRRYLAQLASALSSAHHLDC